MCYICLYFKCCDSDFNRLHSCNQDLDGRRIQKFSYKRSTALSLTMQDTSEYHNNGITQYARCIKPDSHVHNPVGWTKCKTWLDATVPTSLPIVPFGVTYEKIGTIQRRLAWPLHKDDTLSRSGRSTDLNIYFGYWPGNLFRFGCLCRRWTHLVEDSHASRRLCLMFADVGHAWAGHSVYHAHQPFFKSWSRRLFSPIATSA